MIADIQTYFNTILTPQLTDFGVSAEFQSQILSTVEKQMYSVFVNWSDQEFIKALFLTVSEEAPFYSPDAKDYVKSFVVLTIRNSPIESLQSDDYQKSGLSAKLINNQIRQITSKAIEFYDGVDFSTAAENAEYVIENDVYYMLSQNYILAWNALTHTANGAELSGTFSGMRYEKLPMRYKEVFEKKSSSATEITVMDGYDSTIDKQLRRQLSYIVSEKKGALSIDCFKMLSRNLEKVLFVMDYLLQHDCYVVTANYCIGNGYYEIRTPILKAASSSNAMCEMNEHFHSFEGVGKLHKRFLMSLQS